MYRFEKCWNNVVHIWSKCWEQCKEVKDHLKREKDTTERKIGNTMHKSKEVWKHNAQSSGNTNNRFEKCGNTMYKIKAKFGINVKEQRKIWRKNVQLAGIFGKTDVQIKRKAWTQYCTSSSKLDTRCKNFKGNLETQCTHETCLFLCLSYLHLPCVRRWLALQGQLQREMYLQKPLKTYILKVFKAF